MMGRLQMVMNVMPGGCLRHCAGLYPIRYNDKLLVS